MSSLKREYILTYEDGHTITVMVEDANAARQILRSWDVLKHYKDRSWYVERVVARQPIQIVVKSTGEVIK